MAQVVSRRTLLRNLAMGAASCAALPALGAANAPHLDAKDPAAVALGYVEDAAKVDRQKYPGFAAGNNCDTCSLLLGKGGGEYQPCALFPGKLVNVHGWCKSWAPQI